MLYHVSLKTSNFISNSLSSLAVYMPSYKQTSGDMSAVPTCSAEMDGYLCFSRPTSLPARRDRAKRRVCTVSCRASSVSLPRLVVLPGMDGTDLLLTKFRETTSSADDSDRVVGVRYPFTKPLNVPELANYVKEKYLKELEHDPRGYILINQSFSGHVGMHLSQLLLPGNLRGQVFSNAFAAPPGPSFLRNIPPSITTPLFRNQPPPWLVGSIFLGSKATGMDTVQAAASKVEPAVMSQRLSLCLTENSWHLWRRADLIPSESTLYIRGDGDVIVPERDARQLRLARPDIPWVNVPEGPHLLLQRHGVKCGEAINQFCTRLA